MFSQGRRRPRALQSVFLTSRLSQPQWKSFKLVFPFAENVRTISVNSTPVRVRGAVCLDSFSLCARRTAGSGQPLPHHPRPRPSSCITPHRAAASLSSSTAAMSPALMRVLRVVVLLSAVRGAPLGTVTLPPVILEPVTPAPPEPAAAEPVPLEPVPVPSEPVRVDSGADQNISIPINTEVREPSYGGVTQSFCR